MIQETVKNEMREAMREKNGSKVNALRSLMAAFTNALVEKRRLPSELIDDELAVSVVKKAIKQRKDSMEQFQKGGRNDLAVIEEEELNYIKKYLPASRLGGPASLPAEEIKKLAEAKRIELGISDKSKIGLLVGAVVKELKGRADGAEVKEVVEKMF